MNNCDACKHYNWYYDKCSFWNCYTDYRSCCNHFEKIDTNIYDIMTGKDKKEMEEK